MTYKSACKSYIRFTILVICLCLISTLNVAADKANKWVLLVGIDDYKAGHISDLRGCVNDVMLMRDILVGKFNVPTGNIKILINEQATRKAIINAIKTHLINNSKANDIVILHFSGHGSQMEDSSGDENDGLEETLVPHDSRTAGVYDINDDEINGLLNQLTEKTKNVTFIFDSCHSGDAARAGNTVRMIKPDNRPPPQSADFAISSRSGEGITDMRLNDSQYVLISGCQAKELSNEAKFNGQRHGALTWYLSRALREAGKDSTYRGIMDEVKSEVSIRFPSQHPQIEGPGTDLVVFGTDRINAKPYVLVKPIIGQKVEVSGGKVYGLHSGTSLKVYAPKTAIFKEASPVATIKITSVEDFAAEAEIIKGGPIKPHSRATLEAAFFGATSIPVYLEVAQPEALKRLKEALGAIEALSIVKDESSARLLVREQNGKIVTQSGDLEILVPPVPLTEQEPVERVVGQLKDLMHWMMVLDLKNTSSGINISFNFRRKDDPPEASAPEEVKPGTHLIYTVENLDDQSLYVYVLDVSSDGSVALLNRKPGDQELPPGKKLEKIIRMGLPNGRKTVLDVLKVIATTQQIDPSVFPQGSIRGAPPPNTRAMADPLSRFLSQSMRGKRAAEPVEVKSWVTKQKSVRIRRQAAQLTSYWFHFDDKKDSQEIENQLNESRSKASDAAPVDWEDCKRLVTVSKDGSQLECIPARQRRSDNETISIGEAFDEAYNKQDATGALRVEPMIEVQVPAIENDQGIDKRDIGWDDAHDDAAQNDDLWSLKQIQVFDAWKKIRDRFGSVEGAEAEGILIAHPDTGYRHHPETWQEINGKRPIDPTKGHDYFDDDEDPFDPLLSGNLLDNPGHGTASGSVIVSPAGCQLQVAEGCVNGIARGAQLVPLRVHRTVSQFNTSNLAKSIRDTADGNIQGEPRLVSIAMGGPPTLALWKAVKTAEDNGVLIVAAAGNYVRTVVWPARFRSTIAVAANNVRCQPWEHTSRGEAVDISAPGESVWRATLNQDHVHINAMGKGTTFATGNTAGASALWFAWHRDNPKMQELQQRGLVTQAFRQALKDSAWQPNADTTTNLPETHCDTSSWDSDFGSGILNAAALLDVSLVVPDTRSIEKREIEELPLFASLFPPGTDPGQIKSNYLSLFSTKREADFQELTAFETEILYHYTMSEDVRRAIDAMVQGQRGIEPIERVRRALLKQDLSNRFRKTLIK
jgi:uncharacterized caspase-like protein